MRSSSTEVTATTIFTALEATHGVTLLRGVLNEAPARAVLELLHALTAPEQQSITIAEAYSRAFNELAAAVNAEEMPHGLRDAWQAYLVTRILDDSNPWSTLAEQGGSTCLPPGLRAQAQRDLRALRLLFELTGELVWQAVSAAITPSLPGLRDAWVPWYDLAPTSTNVPTSARDNICQAMARASDWQELVDTLAAYWARHGNGLFARYHVLRWQGADAGLHGIGHPDPVRLENLIGYTREQNILKTNTERFLRGLPVHDVVLYGAPGTGKSSTVKALANTYADHGLRLVEVRKEQLSDLPTIVAQLRGRAPRFLLFIDDLSFEEHETGYKALKVLLEGTAEARPENVLIYTTTNRLNLVRENFSDRGKPTDDVNWRDTMEEKNSLVARFGLRVTFATPNQERYLHIVSEMARQRGLSLSEEDLRLRALAWERQRTGRSGRVARQFIDDLQAEQAK